MFSYVLMFVLYPLIIYNCLTMLYKVFSFQAVDFRIVTPIIMFIGVDLFSRLGGGGVIGVPACEGAKRPSGGRVWEGGYPPPLPR